MTEEAQFIIKEDKYTLSIIKNSKKHKKGISIFKKTLELNELNEDNINILLNNSKKDEIIYSYANIGFISISEVICFAYCSEKDIKEIGILCLIKVYQVRNISFIILQPDISTSKKKEINNLFKEFKQYEINRGLIFTQQLLNLSLSFDLIFHHFYDKNTNICHINPNINFCYNYDYITYFRKFSLEDFSTHLICGYYFYNKMKNQQKEEVELNLIIKDKELKEDKNDNEKMLREIEIVLTPKNLIFSQFFHFLFYSFIGDIIKEEKIIYNLLKNEHPENKVDNGSIIILDILNKIKGKNNEEKDNIKIDIINKIEEKFGNNNKILFIEQKSDIENIIEKNKEIFEEIKFNYELKNIDYTFEYEKNQLLVISDNEINSLNIIENILYSIKYKFLDESGEMIFKNEINEYIKTIMKSYKNFIRIKNNNFLKIEKISSQPLNEEFLDKNLFKNTKKEEKKEKNGKEENKENEEKEKNEDSLEIDFGTMKDNLIKKDSINEESSNININEIIEEKNKILELKNIEENSNKISLYIVTNNVANYDLENEYNEESLKKLLFPKETQRYFSKNNYPTFYCIGLQEIVKLNTSNIIFAANKNYVNLWETKIKQLLQKNYNYTLQYKENLVGILFLFFVKASEAKNISEMKKSVIKAGFLNKLGNKGYILYEFKYKNKIFSFCTGHLTAGQTDKQYQNRVNLLIDILNHKFDGNSNRLFQNDFYFLFGDMNFRVKIDKDKFFEQIHKISLDKKVHDDTYIRKKTIKDDDIFGPYVNKKVIKKRKRSGSVEKMESYNYLDDIEEEKYINNNINKNPNNENFELVKRKITEEQFKYNFYEQFIENEELNELKMNLEQYNINENQIKFLPTYKYIKGYNYYNVSKRLPSWTDRILFKKNKNINCLYYDKIDLRYSDHRPVYALFEIKIEDLRKSL